MNQKKGITLIGMPGSGKSTIGERLAKHLNFKFIDLDIYIKEKEGKSHDLVIKDIGEEAFIKLEEKYALELDLRHAVFSPGGSIIYSEKAMKKLRDETLIFYIELPQGEIERRLRGKLRDRGIIGLREKGLGGLFRDRTPVYKSCAHHILNCDGLSLDSAVAGMLDILSGSML